MVIFYSYVKLPEGTIRSLNPWLCSWNKSRQSTYNWGELSYLRSVGWFTKYVPGKYPFASFHHQRLWIWDIYIYILVGGLEYFPYIGNNHSQLTNIFQRLETTNQYIICIYIFGYGYMMGLRIMGNMMGLRIMGNPVPSTVFFVIFPRETVIEKGIYHR